MGLLTEPLPLSKSVVITTPIIGTNNNILKEVTNMFSLLALLGWAGLGINTGMMDDEEVARVSKGNCTWMESGAGICVLTELVAEIGILGCRLLFRKKK